MHTMCNSIKQIITVRDLELITKKLAEAREGTKID